MTRQAAEAAGDLPRLPILAEHQEVRKVGLLVVAGDRGLAGAFNSNAVRAGIAAGRAHGGEGRDAVFFASGRRAASSLAFRGHEPADSFTGFTERPSYADARRIAERLMAAFIDEEVDQVEVFYNGYISPLTQVMRRETLLPLQRATILDDEEESDERRRDGDEKRLRQAGAGRVRARARRRSSSGWSPTTSRSRSTVRCWSQARPSWAPA